MVTKSDSVFVRKAEKEWEAYYIHIRKRAKQEHSVSEEDITYYLGLKSTGDMIGWVVDMSLLFDYGIFKYKPPKVLRYLLESGREASNTLIADIIHYEKTVLSVGEADFEQMRHVIYLKNIIDWVAKRKGATMQQRRKLIAGDLR